MTTATCRVPFDYFCRVTAKAGPPGLGHFPGLGLFPGLGHFPEYGPGPESGPGPEYGPGPENGPGPAFAVTHFCRGMLIYICSSKCDFARLTLLNEMMIGVIISVCIYV